MSRPTRSHSRRPPRCAILTALALGGCAPAAHVDHRTPLPRSGLVLSWRQTSPGQGEITAAFAGGRPYTGTLYQITDQTSFRDIRPLRMFWGIGSVRNFGSLGDWDDGTELLTRFSGKLLAILQGPAGRMRCSFTPSQPSLGLAGGGTGWCQLSHGGGVDATLPPAPVSPAK